MNKILFCLSLITLSVTSYSELYRCEQANGKFQYTDKPCPTSGTTYTPKTNITQYKDIDAVNIKRPFKPSTYPQTTCPHFSSTELRNLRVKDKFKKGLTQEHIKQRFGEPNNISTNNSKSVFSYKDDNVNRIFRFKNGCLTGWKETWKNQESKISKFRGER